MKVRWIQLKQALNLPGPGSASKWHSSNAPGINKGQVREIRRDNCGYWMLIAAGQNAGWYHIPFEFVHCAMGDPPAEILAAIAEEEAAKKASEEAAKAPPVVEPTKRKAKTAA